MPVHSFLLNTLFLKSLTGCQQAGIPAVSTGAPKSPVRGPSAMILRPQGADSSLWSRRTMSLGSVIPIAIPTHIGHKAWPLSPWSSPHPLHLQEARHSLKEDTGHCCFASRRGYGFGHETHSEERHKMGTEPRRLYLQCMGYFIGSELHGHYISFGHIQLL